MLKLRMRALRPLATGVASCVSVAGLAVIVNQARNLGSEWRTQLKSKAKACQGPTEGLERQIRVESAASEHSRSVGPLLVFLGDSLVSGVGGQGDDAPAPAALPKSVALHLAESLDSEVHWASVGITGADVDRLREEGLPRLKEKIAAHRACQAGKHTDVIVVLVVGANDLRKLKLLGYRLALRRLVDEVRLVAHPHQAVDMVFLPALRIPDAPMLQRFPLQYVVNPVCALWEREKRKAVAWFCDTQVLTCPPPPNHAPLECFFSPDLMHPSSSGYDWWAQSLARQIHQELLQRRVAKATASHARLQVAEDFSVREHPLLSALRRHATCHLCDTQRLAAASLLV